MSATHIVATLGHWVWRLTAGSPRRQLTTQATLPHSRKHLARLDFHTTQHIDKVDTVLKNTIILKKQNIEKHHNFNFGH